MSILLSTFSEWLGLNLDDLDRIISSAPTRYKVFYIKKRSGGDREIAQPAREVKALQRVLVDKFLSNLPVHTAATAYRAGASILKNAESHAGRTPILKMDFENFFPSIHGSDWEQYCRSLNLFDEDDVAATRNILFRRAKGERTLKLSIGAPSSPMLSNILLFDFDRIIFDEASMRGITYTRYADDITFSGQRIGMLKDMVEIVADLVRRTKSPRLVINESKTVFSTTATRRFVTGVTLANDGSVSIGHSRKKNISAKVHHAKTGRLNSRQLSELAGILSFANVVEPNFIRRLERKYGLDTVKSIQGAPRVRRKGRFEN